MSKNFETISNDELIEKIGLDRTLNAAQEAGLTDEQYLLQTAGDHLAWEVQTDEEGNVIAVVAPTTDR